MTYQALNYRLSERRTAYANFEAYLEYLIAEQAENRTTRCCIVRIVKVRGCDGEISASEGWPPHDWPRRQRWPVMPERLVASMIQYFTSSEQQLVGLEDFLEENGFVE